jgi:hypothetical protein
MMGGDEAELRRAAARDRDKFLACNSSLYLGEHDAVLDDPGKRTIGFYVTTINEMRRHVNAVILKCKPLNCLYFVS